MSTTSLYGAFHRDIWRLLLGHYVCYSAVKKMVVLNSVFSLLIKQVLLERKYQRRDLGFICMVPVRRYGPFRGGHAYVKCLEFLPDGRPMILLRELSKEHNRLEGRIYICYDKHGLVPLTPYSNRFIYRFVLARNKRLLYECRIEDDGEWSILEFSMQDGKLGSSELRKWHLGRVGSPHVMKIDRTEEKLFFLSDTALYSMSLLLKDQQLPLLHTVLTFASGSTLHMTMNHQDGSLLLCSTDGTCSFIDTNTEQTIKHLKMPEGSIALCTDANGFIYTTTKAHKEIQVLRPDGALVYSRSIDQVGNTFAVREDGRLFVLDLMLLSMF